MNEDKFQNFDTEYGKIKLYKNEAYIIKPFLKGSYWDIDKLLEIKKYINPNKNILEIGGHSGTSTIIYAKYLNDNNKVYVYEPQQNQFNLLKFNIEQNNLQNKIEPFNYAVFCKNMNINMNEISLDCGGGCVLKRYNKQYKFKCNFGGIGLGLNGEKVKAITVDSMNHSNIGFIHCDAQGAENHIFSQATNLIKKYKPTILYENNQLYATYLYNNVCNSYPEFNQYSNFNLEKYCTQELKYSNIIHQFCSGQDDLLIP